MKNASMSLPTKFVANEKKGNEKRMTRTKVIWGVTLLAILSAILVVLILIYIVATSGTEVQAFNYTM